MHRSDILAGERAKYFRSETAARKGCAQGKVVWSSSLGMHDGRPGAHQLLMQDQN